MEQQLTQLRLGWRREHERLKDCVNNVAFLNCFKMFNMVSKFGSCVLLQASNGQDHEFPGFLLSRLNSMIPLIPLPDCLYTKGSPMQVG